MNPCKIDADCEEWNDGCTRPSGCRIAAVLLSRASAGSPLRWTKTPPTEPGWYWIRGCVLAHRKPTPVEVWRGEFGMRIRQSNGGNTYIDNLPHIEWAGPIPEPPDDAENTPPSVTREARP